MRSLENSIHNTTEKIDKSLEKPRVSDVMEEGNDAAPVKKNIENTLSILQEARQDQNSAETLASVMAKKALKTLMAGSLVFSLNAPATEVGAQEVNTSSEGEQRAEAVLNEMNTSLKTNAFTQLGKDLNRMRDEYRAEQNAQNPFMRQEQMIKAAIAEEDPKASAELIDKKYREVKKEMDGKYGMLGLRGSTETIDVMPRLSNDTIGLTISGSLDKINKIPEAMQYKWEDIKKNPLRALVETLASTVVEDEMLRVMDKHHVGDESY